MQLKQQHKGFVILYAVIITTVVLVVGVSLMNIITKQLVLSSIGRNSKLAYYAALSGKECAEYWKTANGNYFGQQVDRVVDPATGATSLTTEYPNLQTQREMVGCPNPTIDSQETRLIEGETDGTHLDLNTGVYYTVFQIQLPGELCSRVKVTFDPAKCNAQQLLVESEGYNVSCEHLNDYNPRRVKSIYSDLVKPCP